MEGRMNRGPRRNVCRYFMASGSCQYGDQCQFLHVEHRKSPSGPVGMLPLDHRKKLDRHPFHPHQPINMPALPQPLMPHKSASAPLPRPQLMPYNSPRQPHNHQSHNHQSHNHQSHNHQSHGKQFGSATRAMGSLQPPPLPSKSASAKLRAPKSSSANAQIDAGGTTYFYSAQQPSYMADHTSFAQMPTHILRGSGKPSYFISSELKKDLLHRQSLYKAVPTAEYSGPSEVDTYHSLCPLESIDATPPNSETQRTFGHASNSYRATSSKDGLYYCLRRLHGVRLTTHKSVQQFEKWRKVEHANLVPLREMFTTKAFGDNSVVFVYDYLPGADTLHSRHLQHGRRARAVLEDLLWDYLIQLVSALRAVHGAGLALRCLEPTKILVTGSGSPRLWVNCAGIMDIMTYDSSSSQVSPTLQQQQDLQGAGQLLLSVALQSPTAAQSDHFHQSMETFTAQFSPDLSHIVQYFLRSSSEGPAHSVAEVLSMIGGRVYHCLERVQRQRDWLEGEASKELECGRLFRLLAKLGTITERPEYDGDPQWSETGDRYLLKLFRDFLFHQVQPSGGPWVDLGHIVQTLNKLDAGVHESILLHSRDEQSVLIVSYADLKSCLDSAFTELLTATQSDP